MKISLIFSAALLCATLTSAQNTLDVHFARNDHSLNAKAKKSLNAFLKQQNPADVIGLTAEGHTDGDGTHAYNKTLSQKRVEAVNNYLVKKGWDKEVSAIHLDHFGEERPVKPNTDARNKADNRRVTLRWALLSELDQEEPGFVKDNYQTTLIDPTASNTITGSKGTKIYIPPMAFADGEGNLVTESVTIKLKEFYTKKDLVLNGVTTNAGTRILETGGAVEIRAFSEESGEELTLAPEEKLGLEFNSIKDKGVPMETFYGRPEKEGSDWAPANKGVKMATSFSTHGDKHGVLFVNFKTEGEEFKHTTGALIDLLVDNYDGEEPLSNMHGIQILHNYEKILYFDLGDKKIAKKLSAKVARETVVRTKQQDLTKNFITSRRLGFINCDRFLKVANKMNLRVKNLKITGTVFFLVFEKLKAVLNPVGRYADKVSFRNVPEGEKVTLVSFVKMRDQQYLFGYKKMELDKNRDFVTLSYRVVDEATFQAILDNKL